MKNNKNLPANSEVPTVERQQPPEGTPKQQPLIKRLLFGEERPRPYGTASRVHHHSGYPVPRPRQYQKP